MASILLTMVGDALNTAIIIIGTCCLLAWTFYAFSTWNPEWKR